MSTVPRNTRPHWSLYSGHTCGNESKTKEGKPRRSLNARAQQSTRKRKVIITLPKIGGDADPQSD